MKIPLLITLIIIALTRISLGQQYYSFPDSNTYWYEVHRPAQYWIPGNDPYSNIFGILNQDTLINNNLYHKLYKFKDDYLLPDSAEYIGAIREEAKKVYYIGPDYFGVSPFDSVDIILYDFSLSVGDTFTNGLFTINEYLVVSEIDSILINNNYRKRIHFQDYWWVKWIEGVGNQNGLIFYSGDVPTNGIWNSLVCLSEDNKVIYHNPDYDFCYYPILNNTQYRNLNDQMSIMPNPFKDNFIISLINSSLLIKSVTVYDLHGKLSLHENMLNGNFHKVNTVDLFRGVFVLRVELNNGRTVSKIILKE